MRVGVFSGFLYIHTLIRPQCLRPHAHNTQGGHVGGHDATPSSSSCMLRFGVRTFFTFRVNVSGAHSRAGSLLNITSRNAPRSTKLPAIYTQQDGILARTSLSCGVIKRTNVNAALGSRHLFSVRMHVCVIASVYVRVFRLYLLCYSCGIARQNR